jgi:hypothetical protein
MTKNDAVQIQDIVQIGIKLKRSVVIDERAVDRDEINAASKDQKSRESD